MATPLSIFVGALVAASAVGVALIHIYTHSLLATDIGGIYFFELVLDVLTCWLAGIASSLLADLNIFLPLPVWHRKPDKGLPPTALAFTRLFLKEPVPRVDPPLSLTAWAADDLRRTVDVVVPPRRLDAEPPLSLTAWAAEDMRRQVDVVVPPRRLDAEPPLSLTAWAADDLKRKVEVTEPPRNQDADRMTAFAFIGVCFWTVLPNVLILGTVIILFAGASCLLFLLAGVVPLVISGLAMAICGARFVLFCLGCALFGGALLLVAALLGPVLCAAFLLVFGLALGLTVVAVGLALVLAVFVFGLAPLLFGAVLILVLRGVAHVTKPVRLFVWNKILDLASSCQRRLQTSSGGRPHGLTMPISRGTLGLLLFVLRLRCPRGLIAHGWCIALPRYIAAWGHLDRWVLVVDVTRLPGLLRSGWASRAGLTEPCDDIPNVTRPSSPAQPSPTLEYIGEDSDGATTSAFQLSVASHEIVWRHVDPWRYRLCALWVNVVVMHTIFEDTPFLSTEGEIDGSDADEAFSDTGPGYVVGPEAAVEDIVAEVEGEALSWELDANEEIEAEGAGDALSWEINAGSDTITPEPVDVCSATAEPVTPDEGVSVAAEGPAIVEEDSDAHAQATAKAEKLEMRARLKAQNESFLSSLGLSADLGASTTKPPVDRATFMSTILSSPSLSGRDKFRAIADTIGPSPPSPSPANNRFAQFLEAQKNKAGEPSGTSSSSAGASQ